PTQRRLGRALLDLGERKLADHIPVHLIGCRTGRLSGLPLNRKERPMMKNPVHPGEILREDVLAEIGLSVSEAASRLGISRVALSRVVHGHAQTSSTLAARREEAGVGTARAWLAMQGPTALATKRAAGTPKVRRLQ